MYCWSPDPGQVDRIAIVGQWESASSGQPVADDRLTDAAWRDLGPVFERIHAGERGPELLEGLNLVHIAVVKRALELLGPGS